MNTLSHADAAEIRGRLVGNRSLFSISELYHENSKIMSGAPGIAQSAESVLVAPSGFKRYVFSHRTALPPPTGDRASPVLSAISSRHSSREYSGRPLTLQAISALLFYANGTPDGGYRRCLPSAGGLYPLEVYAVAIAVDGLASGLYHYDVRAHSLIQLQEGDLRPDLARAIFIGEAVQTAAAVFMLTGVFGRSKIKYGERAYRFVLLEAGHAMQNICLTATALGLAACPVGGFVDDTINDLLQVDGIDEAAVYAVTLGRPREP